MAQGKLTEALQAYRDSLAIAERLAKADPGNAGWQHDLAASYNKVGNVLVAQGNLAEALQAYRDSVVIIERLAKADPGNAGWQHDLSVAYNGVGDVLVAQGNLAEALQAYRDSVVIIERLAKADRSNAKWQDDLQYGIDRIGSLAYRFVLAHDFARGLEAADQAISLAPDKIWLYSNRAHALMFLGRVDEARSIYLKYRGEKNLQSGKSWETVVLEDFAELGKAGLAHPLMSEVEARFAARG